MSGAGGERTSCVDCPPPPPVSDFPLSLSPPRQEPQRPHQQAEGTCHCPLQPPPWLRSWTLHPSGLQTSATPSELQVFKILNTGRESRLPGSLVGHVVLRSPHLFPVKRTQILLLSEVGAEVFLTSLSEGPLSPAFVTLLFPVTSSLTNQIPTPGRDHSKSCG